MPSSYAHLVLHIVYSTKNRQPLIQSEMKDRLHSYIAGILQSEGAIPIIVYGMPDHIHLLAHFKLDKAISDVMRTVKARSTKWVKETYPENAAFSWQVGFGAFSVSHSQVDVVRDYIQNQDAHHKYASFIEEYEALLKAHKIEYNSKYL